MGRRWPTAPRCTTPITRAIPPSYRYTSLPGTTTFSRIASGSSWVTSPPGSTSLVCCSPATRRTPTGTARSSPSRRRASLPPTTTRRVCRCAWRCSREWCGRWRIPISASSSPTRWISAAISRSACRTLGPWPANTPTGRRCTSASGCFPRTSTRPIPGSSRTSGSSGSRTARLPRSSLESPGAACGCAARRSAALVADRYDHVRPAATRGLHGHFLVERPAQQRAPERRVHADVAGGHVELVRSHDAVARARAVLGLELDPRAEEHAPDVRGRLVDDHQPLEAPAQEAHAAVDFPQTPLAVGVLGVLGSIALCGGGGDRLGDSRTLLAPQLLELCAQPLRSCGGGVFRGRRRRLPKASHRSNPVNYVALTFTEIGGSVEHLTDGAGMALLTFCAWLPSTTRTL